MNRVLDAERLISTQVGRPNWYDRLHRARDRFDQWLAPRLWPGLAPAAWLFLTMSGVAFAVRFGLRTPFADEWRWTEQLLGTSPITWEWLWQAENGHRAPLFKLIYLGLMRLSGFDFRSGAVASVMLLSAASLAALLVVRRERGRWQWTDIILPAVLLNWCQQLNLTWGFQLFYVLPACLVSLFLAIATWPTRGFALRGLAMASILCCLAGCGGPGLCYFPPLACWLFYAAVHQLRCSTGLHRAAAASVGLLSLAVLGTIPLYFAKTSGVAATDPTHLAMSFDPLRSVISAVQVLVMSSGRFAAQAWPGSGLIMVGMLTGIGGWLSYVALHDRQQRVRALSLLAVAASVVGLAVGIGAARWQIAPDYCLERRYMTLSAPLLVAMYLAVVCYSRRTCRPGTSLLIAASVIGILVPYQRNGWHNAQQLATITNRIELKVREGLPPDIVAARCMLDSQCDLAHLTRSLDLLQRASIGPYRHLPGDLASNTIPLRCVSAHTAMRAPVSLDLDTQQWRFQPIPMAAGRLCGIDFRLRELLRVKTAGAIAWQLVTTDSDGVRSVLESGVAEIAPLQDPEFAQLRFEPIAIPASSTLELALRASTAATIHLPLYQLRGHPEQSGLQLFAYFSE